MGRLSAHLVTAMLPMYPGHNAQGSFCHRSSRGLVLGARDFHRLEAAIGIQGGRAQGMRRAPFWAISNPYSCGTPPILSPRVLGCQPGGLWVPRLLPLHFGAFEGGSTIKSSLKVGRANAPSLLVCVP